MKKTAILALGVLLGVGSVVCLAATISPEVYPEPIVTEAPAVSHDDSAVSHGDSEQLPDLPPCPTEDSEGCYWDASEQGNQLGDDFVSQPAPEEIQEAAPVTEDERRQDYDLGMLECGVNAFVSVDKDQYGNNWAYCEPLEEGESR